jgi:hypothetical protein
MNLARLAAAVLLAIAAPALAQDAAKKDTPFEPQVGQAGKDVIWVPTPQKLVDAMLDMAKATPKDYLMDLGSGDGRLVITAAKRGIRAKGIEYDPDMVDLSRRNAEKEGVADKATFLKADLFKTNFSEATVITMFLLPALNEKLKPQLLRLKPGTRIVSNSFDMGDWQEDQKIILDTASGCEGYCTARLWIIPARVDGTHQTAHGELKLKQAYQMLTGTLARDGKSIPVTGKVSGTDVTLTVEGKRIRGKWKDRKLELGM